MKIPKLIKRIELVSEYCTLENIKHKTCFMVGCNNIATHVKYHSNDKEWMIFHCDKCIKKYHNIEDYYRIVD